MEQKLPARARFAGNYYVKVSTSVKFQRLTGVQTDVQHAKEVSGEDDNISFIQKSVAKITQE